MESPLRVLRQQELPPAAAQLAGTYQLGAPQADYKVGLTSWMVSYIIMGIVGFVLCSVIAVFYIW